MADNHDRIIIGSIKNGICEALLTETIVRKVASNCEQEKTSDNQEPTSNERIKIVTDGSQASIFINDKNISHLVRRYTLEHRANGIPILKLELNGTSLTVFGKAVIYSEEFKEVLSSCETK